MILTCVVLAGGLWLSYKLFNRGDSDDERITSQLPKGFKADWSWHRGDTYVGYEQAGNRLAIVDYPHAAVVAPAEVKSIEPLDEGAGIVHRFLVFHVASPPGKLRIWFGRNSGDRDAALAKLNSLR